jgi:hypothetical protein
MDVIVSEDTGMAVTFGYDGKVSYWHDHSLALR